MGDQNDKKDKKKLKLAKSAIYREIGGGAGGHGGHHEAGGGSGGPVFSEYNCANSQGNSIQSITNSDNNGGVGDTAVVANSKTNAQSKNIQQQPASKC